ncbi:MAG: HD domain-containing protein [Ferruginibacter sp.]
MPQPQESPDFAGAEKFMLHRLKEELSPDLPYHALHHTLDVLNAAMQIAAHEDIASSEILLLRIAVIFHDAGFLLAYHGHEEKSCGLATEILPKFGFTKEQVEKICRLIMATKMPQQPRSLPEQIICDADLDYVGRKNASVIANRLYRELKLRKEVSSKKEWYKTQIAFLESHHYHTSFSKKERNTGKQEYLRMLKEKLAQA